MRSLLQATAYKANKFTILEESSTRWRKQCLNKWL